VGVFFVTQTPKDIPSDVLGQLGNRIQHALRAFTPDDQKALSAAVKTYPKSDFYDMERLLQEMGIGEAAVTILDEKGVPTPVVHSRMPGTRSLMDKASADLDAVAKGSPLYTRYGTRSEAQSARELLAERMAATSAEAQAAEKPAKPAPAPKPPSGGPGDTIGDFLGSRQGKALQRDVVRGIFGMLKKRL
jgi:hypothetical protein